LLGPTRESGPSHTPDQGPIIHRLTHRRPSPAISGSIRSDSTEPTRVHPDSIIRRHPKTIRDSRMWRTTPSQIMGRDLTSSLAHHPWRIVPLISILWTRNIRITEAMSPCNCRSPWMQGENNCSSTSINTRTSSDVKVDANQSFWHYSAHLFSEPYTHLSIGAGLSEPPDAVLFFRWTRNYQEQTRQTSDWHVTYRKLSQQLGRIHH